VFEQVGPDRIEADTHPVAQLLRAPNANQTWVDFCEWLIASTLLWGNGLAEIVSDTSGRPTALVPIPWRCVSVQMLPTGRLAYDVVAVQGQFGGTGTPRRLLTGEVLHLRDRSDDGLIGRSRLSRAPEVIQAALGLQRYSSSIWDNAAAPSGIVTVPQGLKGENLRRFKQQWEQRYTGSHNGKKVVFGDNGTVFSPMSVSPEDAEILQSKAFTVSEISRLFQIPPPLIQDYSRNTFNNCDTANLWFATTSLMPWASKLRAEFARSLFGDQADRYHIELDFSALTKGDYASKMAADVAAVGAGIRTKNEVRAENGDPPLPDEEPDGDEPTEAQEGAVEPPEAAPDGDEPPALPPPAKRARPPAKPRPPRPRKGTEAA
jgi:HK97 family phage portal protein